MCTDMNKCCPKDNFPSQESVKLLTQLWEARRWHYWTVFQGTIRFGFMKKMKKRLVSLPHLVLIVTSECLRVFAMPVQYSAE
jgi:hypothetical protein